MTTSNAFAFVIGFFVAFNPLFLAWRFPLIAGLIHGIVGIGITIWILEMNK